MEQSEGNDVSGVSNKVEVSPKSKQKKKSLCRMLMNKKTKVGCLESSYNGDSNRNSKIENSHHGSQTSTKLSLCCAMTERSRTPPQSLTVSRLSPTLSRTSVKSEIASINEDHQTDVLVESREDMQVVNELDQEIAQAVQETVVRRSNIAVGKEQRPSTYIEGKLGNCVTDN